MTKTHRCVFSFQKRKLIIVSDDKLLVIDNIKLVCPNNGQNKCTEGYKRLATIAEVGKYT